LLKRRYQAWAYLLDLGNMLHGKILQDLLPCT